MNLVDSSLGAPDTADMWPMATAQDGRVVRSDLGDLEKPTS